MYAVNCVAATFGLVMSMKSAVRTPPTCRNPVGAGANLTRTGGLSVTRGRRDRRVGRRHARDRRDGRDGLVEVCDVAGRGVRRQRIRHHARQDEDRQEIATRGDRHADVDRAIPATRRLPSGRT